MSEPSFPVQDARSVALVTLDSCRYDTFESAFAPNLKSIGPLHRAMAPSHFTFGSHASIFVGFTPGAASQRAPYVNPKFGKIFKIHHPGFGKPGGSFFELKGENIIQGFKSLGHRTLGTGAVGWFNPQTDPGRFLTRDFDKFYFPPTIPNLEKQLQWLADELRLNTKDRSNFIFLNIGETHLPYYFEGAPWDPKEPLLTQKDAAGCRSRQRGCLEYVDKKIGPFLDSFKNGTIVVCADHGDCWGEDGLWGHGFHHEKVLEVPLLFRLQKARGT